MTIDEMIAAIEQRVCIRKLWRCNAGWGMFTGPYGLMADNEFSVQRYHDTLQKCVEAEYQRVTQEAVHA